jgi:hypothetical protein
MVAGLGASRKEDVLQALAEVQAAAVLLHVAATKVLRTATLPRAAAVSWDFRPFLLVAELDALAQTETMTEFFSVFSRWACEWRGPLVEVEKISIWHVVHRTNVCTGLT